MFFATPHKGLVVNDIQRMLTGGDNQSGRKRHPREDLLRQISTKSDMLAQQLVDFKNLIRDRKVVSFYERYQTKQLKLVWSDRRYLQELPKLTKVIGSSEPTVGKDRFSGASTRLGLRPASTS
jgi:hypothetical protein